MLPINQKTKGTKLYQVRIGTDTAWTHSFKVYAHNEKEAVDLVADYISDKEFSWLYADHYEVFDLCDVGQTVDEYAEANGLVCVGSHGIYINLINVRDITDTEEFFEFLHLEQLETM